MTTAKIDPGAILGAVRKAVGVVGDLAGVVTSIVGSKSDVGKGAATAGDIARVVEGVLDVQKELDAIESQLETFTTGQSSDARRLSSLELDVLQLKQAIYGTARTPGLVPPPPPAPSPSPEEAAIAPTWDAAKPSLRVMSSTEGSGNPNLDGDPYEGKECDPNQPMPDGWSCVVVSGRGSSYCMVMD